jgi:hypothetical protein
VKRLGGWRRLGQAREGGKEVWYKGLTGLHLPGSPARHPSASCVAALAGCRRLCGGAWRVPALWEEVWRAALLRALLVGICQADDCGLVKRAPQDLKPRRQTLPCESKWQQVAGSVGYGAWGKAGGRAFSKSHTLLEDTTLASPLTCVAHGDSDCWGACVGGHHRTVVAVVPPWGLVSHSLQRQQDICGTGGLWQRCMQQGSHCKQSKKL